MAQALRRHRKKVREQVRRSLGFQEAELRLLAEAFERMGAVGGVLKGKQLGAVVLELFPKAERDPFERQRALQMLKQVGDGKRLGIEGLGMVLGGLMLGIQGFATVFAWFGHVSSCRRDAFDTGEMEWTWTKTIRGRVGEVTRSSNCEELAFQEPKHTTI